MQQQLNELKSAWARMFPGVSIPSDAQWTVWQLEYSDKIIRSGLAELGKKYIKLDGEMSIDYMVKFVSAVMNRMSNTDQAPLAQKGAA